MANYTSTFTLDKALIAKIREHAMRNYSQDGWDYLVECWSDSDILDDVKDCTSFEECIATLSKTLKAMDDYRSEIQSTAF